MLKCVNFGMSNYYFNVIVFYFILLFIYSMPGLGICISKTFARCRHRTPSWKGLSLLKSYVWDLLHNSVMTAHPLQTSTLIKSLPTSRERSNPDGEEQKQRALGWDDLHRQGIALKIGQRKASKKRGETRDSTNTKDSFQTYRLEK